MIIRNGPEATRIIDEWITCPDRVSYSMQAPTVCRSRRVDGVSSLFMG